MPHRIVFRTWVKQREGSVAFPLQIRPRLYWVLCCYSATAGHLLAVDISTTPSKQQSPRKEPEEVSSLHVSHTSAEQSASLVTYAFSRSDTGHCVEGGSVSRVSSLIKTQMLHSLCFIYKILVTVLKWKACQAGRICSTRVWRNATLSFSCLAMIPPG